MKTITLLWKIFTPALAVIIGLSAISVCFAADDVSITISDVSGGKAIVLENSVIKARYQPNSHDGGMVNFIIKAENDDVAGGGGGKRLDAGHNRHAPTAAKIIKDEPDEKTVEIKWENAEKGTQTAQVTIFKDSPVLKINYVHMWHIFEWGANRGTADGRFEIYGAAEWKEQRNWSIMYPDHKQVDFYWYRKHHGNDVPLVYNGHVILGMYHKDTNRGFLRVMPIEKMKVLKLMTGCGFELYHNEDNMTGYLCAITGGADQVLAWGKLLAEGKVAAISDSAVANVAFGIAPVRRETIFAGRGIAGVYSLLGRRIAPGRYDFAGKDNFAQVRPAGCFLLPRDSRNRAKKELIIQQQIR